MASEYLKWKYRDVRPDPPVERTAREKRANWWRYHRWYVALGAGLLAAVLYLVARGLGFGQVTPDYQIAYVGTSALPEETVSALETALAGLGADCSGDGRVVVQLHQYVLGEGADAMYAYGSSTKLLADLECCDSYFFLLEDPETFQSQYQVLRRLDGSLPEETDRDNGGCALAWSECPVLEALPLGQYTENVLGQEISGDNQERLSGLFVARRGFWTEQACAYSEECDALWDAITRGSDQ